MFWFHGKVRTKNILRLLSKVVENMPFLDSEHVAMGEKAPTPKSAISIE